MPTPPPLTPITGPIVLADGSVPAQAVLRLERSAVDTAGGQLVLTGLPDVKLTDGEAPPGFGLVPNLAGLTATRYHVRVLHVVAGRAVTETLPDFQVLDAASYTWAELFATPVPPAPPGFFRVLTEAQANATLVLADEAAAAALASAGLAQTAAANAQASSRTLATWAALAVIAGTSVGEGAEVLDTDAGTHTDPVVGGTVANAGRYSWSVSPAGWRRIGATGLAAKAPVAEPVFIGSYGIGTTTTVTAADYHDGVEDGAGNVLCGIPVGGAPFGYTPPGSTFTDLQTGTLTIDGIRLEADAQFHDGLCDLAGNVRYGVPVGGEAFGYGTGTAAEAAFPFVTWTDVGVNSWYPPNCLQIFPHWGQSNALSTNVDTGDLLISTTPVYPDHALMPAGGPRYTGTVSGALVPLVENVVGSTRETSSSGFANTLIALVEAAMGYRPKIMTFVSAKAGTPIEELNDGAVQYNNLLAGVRDGVAYARANGLIPIVPAVLGTQGESNSQEQPESYFRGVIRLARDLADDIMAITGQADTPKLILTQTRTGAGTATPVAGSSWYANGGALGTLQADGTELVRCAGPMYHLPISSDLLHLACAGQYGKGVQFARAVWGEFGGRGFHPIRCVDAAFLSGSVIRLEFAVPDNDALLIRDANEVTDTTQAKKGFFVTDRFGAAVTVASVVVPTSPSGSINNRFLDLTLATAPAAPVTIHYAQVRDASGDGPVGGARGCLATATAWTDLQSIARRHWCPAFTIKVS